LRFLSWEQIWARDNWLELLQRYMHIQAPGQLDTWFGRALAATTVAAVFED
jgi:hypothetical protein